MPRIIHRIRINIRIRCIIIIALNYKTIQRIICNFLLINYLRTAADGRCKVFSCIGLPSRNVLQIIASTSNSRILDKSQYSVFVRLIKSKN